MRYVWLVGLCVLGWPGLGVASGPMQRDVVRSAQAMMPTKASLAHVTFLEASRYMGTLSGKSLSLGIKHSAILSSSSSNSTFDVLSGIGIAVGVLAGAGFMAVLVVNIVVAAKKLRGWRGWGVAGIVVGGLGTLGTLPPFLIGLTVAANSGPAFALITLGPLIASAALLGLGIHNVVTENRWRARKRKKPGQEIQGFAPVVLPWFNVGKSGDVQGGLALCSSF